MSNVRVVNLHVGTSGWSYPSWRGGFYPEGSQPETFLAFYAQRFDTVELNTTGYRLPSEEQFLRWAEQTPPGFTFAPKLGLRRLDRVPTFVERVRLLRDHLGPVRVVVESPRDNGLLELLLWSVEPGVRVALDLRDASWSGVDPGPEVAVVNEPDGRDASFRYVRLREPPYEEREVGELAARLRGGPETWVFFRHEDEPTAPAYASRLLELL